jgi:prepilin-type N-terminal cleavage/methylation domain-containing protein
MARFTLIELVVAATIAGIGITAGGPALGTFKTSDYQATVTDKVTKRSGQYKDKYLVMTKLDDGKIKVFENTDNWLRLKFNSSDIQASLEQGKTYDIKACGWRIPFLSWYENIIKADTVKKESTSIYQ